VQEGDLDEARERRSRKHWRYRQICAARTFSIREFFELKDGMTVRFRT
jgi:hypothetical protein